VTIDRVMVTGSDGTYTVHCFVTLGDVQVTHPLTGSAVILVDDSRGSEYQVEVYDAADNLVLGPEGCAHHAGMQRIGGDGGSPQLPG